MKFLPHKILLYHLYLFQLEEYDSNRFLKAIKNKGLFPSAVLRKSAKYTTKALLLLTLTFVQQILVLILSGILLQFTFNNILVVLFTLALVWYCFFILSFVFLIQAKDILWPIDYFAKKRLIGNAKAKLKTLNNLKVIGITGSYGKTTMKETLYTFLSEEFKVVKTEGNNNTPIGIAKTILNKLDNSTEFFIVEMGEYVKGDVKALCEIVPPDISVITGINEAHLERYLTMDNAISTKFEIVEFAKDNALVLLNADDALTIQHYKDYVKEKPIKFFSALNDKKCEITFSDYNFDQDGKGQSFKLKIGDKEEKINTSILGEYIIGNIIAGFLLGDYLNIPTSKLKYAANTLKAVEHRLQPIFNPNDILVIDDTYNGNSDGFKQGIKLLEKFNKRRKVYVTPGLVETGSLAESLHLEIGKDLARVADIVILIKNSVTHYIEKGLIDNGFKSENIIWYDNSKVVWEELNTNLKPNDVVLLQNDWSDNYY